MCSQTLDAVCERRVSQYGLQLRSNFPTEVFRSPCACVRVGGRAGGWVYICVDVGVGGGVRQLRSMVGSVMRIGALRVSTCRGSMLALPCPRPALPLPLGVPSSEIQQRQSHQPGAGQLGRYCARVHPHNPHNPRTPAQSLYVI
jgi:hypothetical protein